MRNFAVIGSPIQHSFSPSYYSEKFRNDDIADANYDAIEVKDLSKIREVVQSNNLSGFNVTIPHKQEIIKHLDGINQTAVQMNAVNVVKVVGDKLLGYNTDVMGFIACISQHITRSTKALIFGTGGSSRAVKFGLNKIGIRYELVSRDSKKGLTYSELTKELIEDHQLLINTTPLGMHPNIDGCVDIPFSGITDNHFCFDLIYNPEETVFMKRAKERGAKVINGLKMLQIQADRSWNIWNA